MRNTFPWLATAPEVSASVSERIPPPPLHNRIDVQPGSFGAWLRTLPLKPGRPDVLLYDGTKKANQAAQHAVLDVDVGALNLQQCADAVMRLRAEYLFATKAYDRVHFNFTSGDEARYLAWAEGQRPKIGKKVSWAKTAAKAAPEDYKSFRAYLELVFTYAGSASLEKELVAVASPLQIEPGDVWIQPGFPGHAVIVLDVAASEETGRRVFLAAQSYMPAQEIHVLKNPNDEPLSPWYSSKITGKLVTPEWTFEPKMLKRFSE